MISIDEHPPPDPSSSDNQTHHLQHQQQVSHDIDLLKPTDGNLDDTNNNSLPNFSIRDYVYESRCKNIARNWPFSDKSLRLCLNYGVKNLLPPFQSLDSVRNHLPNEETISNFDSKRKDNSLAHTKSNSQPIGKKFKLVMKLNSGIEQIEETVASKVCPVCKTFSSSSNTTLNAHIDSCLSEESSMKQTEDLNLKTVKHRIKPRKMRLMVDVYKTAPHCTIEELDKRNGTNWATNSSFPDQEIEFQAEEKKKEPQEPVFNPVITDHEGAVYIDKTGKKVRILSMPKFSKVVIKKKKKKAYIQKDIKKMLKISPNSKKLSKKVESGQKENAVIKESCKNGQENKQMDDDLVITRPPWACSKRTGGAKKRAPVYTKQQEDTLLDDSCDSMSKLNNLKRKFTAFNKSQDSLKQRSRTEEDINVLEVKKVKKVKKKKSITSESSNDDSLSESARTEDCIGNEPSFTGLKNSFDNEFSNMISQLDNKFDSQQHIITDHEFKKQGNYHDEVDPIPIPGPPGSFLPPSPGADTGSEEEPQGNSSLTTMSRVQSSEDNNNNNNNNTSDLRSIDEIFKEKGLTPCCCSRKESAFLNNLASYPQEPSVVSRERVIGSDLVNHLTLPPPGMVKSPVISPTTFRLMGKNLTVVNTGNEQVKPSCLNPIGQNENHDSFGYPPQNQCFNLYPPRSRSANMDNTATKEIIVIDDSSDDDHRHHHMFKEPMIRNHAFSFVNQCGNRNFC